MFYMLQQQETIYSLFGFLAIRMRQNQVALAFPYATGIHVSAEAALTQVDQLVCFRLLDIRAG